MNHLEKAKEGIDKANDPDRSDLTFEAILTIAHAQIAIAEELAAIREAISALLTLVAADAMAAAEGDVLRLGDEEGTDVYTREEIP